MRTLNRNLKLVGWRDTLLCAAALVVILLSGACKNGELGGSIGASYDMRFDAIRSYWIGPKLIIIYEKSFTTTEVAASFGDPVQNQVVRLTIDTNRQELVAGEEIFFDRTETDYPALSVDRYVLTESMATGLQQEETYPNLASSHLKFDALSLDIDGDLTGEFECTFTDDRMLWGNFDTTISKP